jgi:putative DNA primase/helicase
MSNTISEHPAPQPVSIETILAGAGGSPQATCGTTINPPLTDHEYQIDTNEVADEGMPNFGESGNPLHAVRSAIANVDARDLLELAHEILGLPTTDSKDEPRDQTQAEIIVLIVAYFEHYLIESGFGALIMNGAPHLYGGTHWHQVDEKAFEAMLGRFAENLGYHVATSRYFAFREKLLKQSFATLVEEVADRPPGSVLINFLNGTLEIDGSGEGLRGFDKADRLTYQLPFGFDESAQCPLFDQYIARVLPDPSSQAVLAEFIGWIFLRELKLEKVLVLFGDGHNGKSVFFDIMCALLGFHNVCNIGLSSLSKMENRFRLAGALLNFGSEISDRCDADLFKKLASGEPVEARKLYKDVFIIRDYARLAFNANVLPKNTEQTTGFFRRFLIVPFTQVITDDEKDPDLALKIISAELPGVFNWVMRGLRRLRIARRFTTCIAAREALTTYRKESDSVAMFLDDEALVPSIDGRRGKNETYTEYRNYCQTSGFSPLSKVNFGKRLLGQHQISASKSGSLRFWNLIRQDDDE